MKNYIIAIATFLCLISCGKSEKPIEPEKLQDTIAVNPKETEIKEVETPIYNYENDSDFSEEMDLNLLAKAATNLKIKYEDVNIDACSSIKYSDKISFFVITYIAESAKEGDEDSGNYFERKFLFVSKIDGKIIAQDLDKNLCYFDDEAGQPSNTYILKKLIQLNETTMAIGLSTEFGSGSNLSLYSEQKFAILALVNNKIIKLLYEYPMRKTQGDSDGSGTFQMESLETAISVSNKKTNGFFDLNVAKTYSYEDEVEEDLEKGIKAKVQPVKYKKEVEKISFNGKKYSFKADDNYRFLKIY